MLNRWMDSWVPFYFHIHEPKIYWAFLKCRAGKVRSRSIPLVSRLEHLQAYLDWIVKVTKTDFSLHHRFSDIQLTRSLFSSQNGDLFLISACICFKSLYFLCNKINCLAEAWMSFFTYSHTILSMANKSRWRNSNGWDHQPKFTMIYD